MIDQELNNQVNRKIEDLKTHQRALNTYYGLLQNNSIIKFDETGVHTDTRGRLDSMKHLQKEINKLQFRVMMCMRFRCIILN